MAYQIPLDKAYLTAIWLETLFYGINILLFFSYLFIARYKSKGRQNKVVYFTAIAMFLFSSVHVSLGFYRLIQGFIYDRDLEGGPSAYFSDVSQPPNVAKVIIHTVNSILGDSIVVWRCYHVWGGSWLICIVPILLIAGSAACGFGQGTIFAQAHTTHSAFGPNLERWNGSLFSLSLVTNIVVTSLIAFRIWYLAHQIRVSSGTSFRYRRVLILVVESGLIYSSAILIEVVLYFISSNAFYIIYDPIAQLTGIVPTTIIVLSSLGMTSTDLNSEETRRTVESRPQFAPPRRNVGNATTIMSAFSAANNPDQSMSDPYDSVDMEINPKAKLTTTTDESASFGASKV